MAVGTAPWSSPSLMNTACEISTRDSCTPRAQAPGSVLAGPVSAGGAASGGETLASGDAATRSIVASGETMTVASGISASGAGAGPASALAGSGPRGPTD